jgi:hypothetical protein
MDSASAGAPGRIERSDRPFESRGPSAANFSANPDVPLNPARQRRFVNEEQIVHEFIHGIAELTLDCFIPFARRGLQVCGDPKLPADSSDEVRHVHLMFEHH